MLREAQGAAAPAKAPAKAPGTAPSTPLTLPPPPPAAQLGESPVGVANFAASGRPEGAPPLFALPPLTIWTFWNDAALPAIVSKCVESMARQNPRHRVVLLTDANVASWVATWPAAPFESVQKKSNWTRLSVLRDYGGVWLDASSYCTAPVEAWVDQDLEKVRVPLRHPPLLGRSTAGASLGGLLTPRPSFFLVPQVTVFSTLGSPKVYTNWAIASPRPGHPVITAWLARLAEVRRYTSASASRPLHARASTDYRRVQHPTPPPPYLSSTPHASHWMGGGAHVLARSPFPGHHQGGAAGAPRTAAPPRGGATCNSNPKHALYPRKRRGVASGSAGRLSKTSNGRLSGLAQTTPPLAEPFGVGSFGALGCPHTAKKAHFWRP